MSRILIAATSHDFAALEVVLRERHEISTVTSKLEALTYLRKQTFDLIMIGVQFDESRMFELLRDLPTTTGSPDTPVICFSLRDTPMIRKIQSSIDGACKACGAWMYLDWHMYGTSKDPDAELLRIIERCLTGEERKVTQASRIDIHKQREELLQLRLALEGEEWSLDLEDRVGEFRESLAAVLLELSELQINSIAQQEKIAESTELKDKVSLPVMAKESAMERQEIRIGLQESEQLGKEQELVPQEELKAKAGRRDLAAGDQVQKSQETTGLPMLPVDKPVIAN